MSPNLWGNLYGQSAPPLCRVVLSGCQSLVASPLPPAFSSKSLESSISFSTTWGSCSSRTSSGRLPRLQVAARDCRQRESGIVQRRRRRCRQAVDCSIAVPGSERGTGPGVFRGHHHRSVAQPSLLRQRPQIRRFTYKGRPVDVKRQASFGSATCSKAACGRAALAWRITAQLIDAATGDHVRTERYDREIDHIFTVQDAEAHDMARRAVALDDRDAEAHTILGMVALFMRRFDDSVRSHRSAQRSKT